MHAPAPSSGADTKRHRPRMSTVFGASFLAGAVLAFGINRVLDVHVTQAQPQVECEPIFVALRSMPQGSPVTIWDVALRDWPKAMLPTTALRAHDTFSGTVLKYPLREGQPLLSVQLVRDTTAAPATAVAEAAAPAAAGVAPPPGPAPTQVVAATPAADAWMPELADPVAPIAEQTAPEAEVEPAPVVEQSSVEPAPAVEQAATPITATPDVPTEGFDEAEVTDLPAAITATPVAVPAPATSDTAETEPTPVATPTPASEPTLADAPALAVEPTPAAAPTPATEPPRAGEPTLADTASLPFAAPVPSLPPTDIGGALAEVSAPRSRLTSAPAPAPATDSVLAAEAAPAASGPKRYLVVPERIALQADASFVDQPPAPPQPEPQPAATAPPRTTSRSASAGSRPAATTTRSPATSGAAKRSAAPAREAAPVEKKPTPRGGGWFSGSPQAWGGIGAALRRPQADQAPVGPR